MEKDKCYKMCLFMGVLGETSLFFSIAINTSLFHFRKKKKSCCSFMCLYIFNLNSLPIPGMNTYRRKGGKRAKKHTYRNQNSNSA